MAAILVIDDHPVVQRVLSAQLRKGGHDAATAGGARQALELLDRQPFDLAILDIAMPEIDGLSLLKQLKTDPKHGSLRVVMLTASGQDEDRVLARSFGADAFLNKPASSWELAETVDRVLGCM